MQPIRAKIYGSLMAVMVKKVPEKVGDVAEVRKYRHDFEGYDWIKHDVTDITEIGVEKVYTLAEK